MPEKIFFQSSMPRASSTLFQNLIGQHPDFYVTPTSGVLELWVGARGNFTTSPEFQAQDSEMMKKAFAGFCREGMLGYFNAITDSKYVLDKSRGHGVYSDFINSFYPNPKIICLVRDLKDIIASFEKIYRKNPQYQPPFLNEGTAQGTMLHKRVDEWLKPTATVGKALERLFEIIHVRGWDRNMLFVKSEDLCLHPDTEMRRVYDYLEIPYFQHDYDNIPQITKEDDDVYGLGKGLHDIRTNLSMKPSDAKLVLGQHVTDHLYKNYQWYYDKFGYKK
jgi:sulfotransferase